MLKTKMYYPYTDATLGHRQDAALPVCWDKIKFSYYMGKCAEPVHTDLTDQSDQGLHYMVLQLCLLEAMHLQLNIFTRIFGCL